MVMVVMMMLMHVVVLVVFHPFLRLAGIHFCCFGKGHGLSWRHFLGSSQGSSVLLLLLLLSIIEREIPKKFGGFHPILDFFPSGSPSSLSVSVLQ